MLRRHVAAVTLTGVAAAALLASGCTSTEDDPAPDGRSTGGPLAALAEPGGQAIAPPPARQVAEDDTWTATFGFPVCTSGPPVTVQGVRLEGTDVPDSSATLRSVDGGEAWSLPLASALGSPPKWEEPYADDTGITGSYAEVEGGEVTQPCAGSAPGEPSEESAYQELLVTLEATPDGSAVSSFHVDYVAGSEEYTVEVPWEMVLCGTGSDPEICPQ